MFFRKHKSSGGAHQRAAPKAAGRICPSRLYRAGEGLWYDLAPDGRVLGVSADQSERDQAPVTLRDIDGALRANGKD